MNAARLGALALLAMLASPARAQLRGPTAASAGATVTLEVGAGHGHVVFGVAGDPLVRWRLVPVDRRVRIEVPNAPSGTRLRVWVGRGASRVVHEIRIR